MSRVRHHDHKSRKNHDKRTLRKSHKHHHSPIAQSPPLVKFTKPRKAKDDKEAVISEADVERLHYFQNEISRILMPKSGNRNERMKNSNRFASQDEVPISKSRQNGKKKRMYSVVPILQKKHSLQKKRKPKSPEHPHITKLTGEGRKIRERIDTESKTAFDGIYDGFMGSLSDIRSKDKTFIESLTQNVADLSTSLSAQEIEVEGEKGGKRTKGFIVVGECISRFRHHVEAEAVKLRELWEQWTAVQSEYDQLAIEVFGDGDKLFPGQAGFKYNMEQLDLQHQSSVEEVRTEVRFIRGQSVKTMTASEKELDVQAKKDRKALLESLLL